MRQDYLLASHIEEDRWFCHKGTLNRDGMLDDGDPFDAKDLVVKDISRDAYEPENAPRCRIGPHTTGPRLVEAAHSLADSWSRAVATATWRAEVLRAARRPFDAAAAGAGFEANPFRWSVAEGWLSHADVAFAWYWWQDGGWSRELVRVSAHDLSAHERGVPTPGSLSEDEHLKNELFRAADKANIPTSFPHPHYKGSPQN